MEEEKKDLKVVFAIDDFYNGLQKSMANLDQQNTYRYITSRSTEENIDQIEEVCQVVQINCDLHLVPTKGAFLRKTDLSVKAFRYFVCNTNFSCQSLLADDALCGRLVKMQPPFSTYLLIEILWHIHFEDILAESLLHFPIDLCVEILEILPRCVDILDFERASKFLTTLVPNVYKRMIILRDSGSQSKDIVENAKRLAGNLQELLLQFTNERFLRFEDISKPDERYEKHGTLLKSIIQMVRMCLTSKSKKVELPCEIVNLYKLTFGQQPVEKIDDSTLLELLAELDRELINLLLKKVKEIDCNIYLNWTEHDDVDNTSLSLQRAIGLECYFFIEKTKEFKDSNIQCMLKEDARQYKDSNIQEYDHLIECLQHLSSKPDPTNSVESLQLVDLCQGAREGRNECLTALFRRYKEWDNAAIDSLDSGLALLDKANCEELLEYLASELAGQPPDQLDTEKLQLFALCLAKALVYQKITDLYEITLKFVMRFGESDNLENAVDITNFERFIMLNPNFSSGKNLRVVLLFLCLKTRMSLKILMKMAIGHSDYPDVAICLDDLMLLLPVLKIRTRSKYETLIQTLRSKCSEKQESVQERLHRLYPKKQPRVKTETVTLAVRILQDICLEEQPSWNAGKFSNLLQLLCSFCKVSEIANEILTPFLFSDSCSLVYLKYTLVELQKLVGKFDSETSQDLITALHAHGVHLLKSNHISRYIVDELLTMIRNLTSHLINHAVDYDYNTPTPSSLRYVFIPSNLSSVSFSVGYYMGQYQCRLMGRADRSSYPFDLVKDDAMRHLLLKCTKKQYFEWVEDLIKSHGKPLNWPSKVDVCENFVRLTLEACLLCLEYPEIAPPDSIGFLLGCLLQLVPMMHTSGKKGKSYRRICLSVDAHARILEDSVGHTVLAEAYSGPRKLAQEGHSNLEVSLAALRQFALVCVQESERLRIYEGPHSPLGVKLWLAYDLVNELLEESVGEEYFGKLAKYLDKS